MSLTKKLLIGTFALAGMLNQGCISIQERNFPEGHISGVEYPKLSQKRVPYKLEDQIIYDKRYYLQETAQMQNSLPMLFYPWETTSRELDLDSGEIKLTSKEMYIPVLVEREKKGEDKFADGITISSTGKYGTKAYMTSMEELKKREGISGNNYGYKIITTEDDSAFMLYTMKILGEEYFVALVEDNKIAEAKKLPFYMIPVRNSKIKIDNICGNLSILNENKVYRPSLITKMPVDSQTQNIIYSTPEPLSADELNAVPTTESIAPTPSPILKK